MVGSADALTNLRDAQEEDGLRMGDRSKSKASKVGDMRGTFYDGQGQKQLDAVLQDVKVVPGGYNLFSATKMICMGWTLVGMDDMMVIQKGDNKIVFDICIDTKDGALYCAYFKSRQATGEVGAAAISLQQAHSHLGHMNEDMTRKSARAIGLEVSKGTLKPCEHCGIGKAKQKNVPKDTKLEETTDAKRAYLDIASIKAKKGTKPATRPHWRMIVLGKFNLKFSRFFKKKNDMVELTCVQFKRWQMNGLGIDTLRMDHAGENKLLQKRCQSADWQLPIEVEYTAKATPQENSPVETGCSCD